MTESRNPMKVRLPYIPLHIGGDEEGNRVRQQAADRINNTTDRVIDTREVVNRFTDITREVRTDP